MVEDVKQAVAEHVKNLVLSTDWNSVVEPAANRVNEARIISNLEVLISIRTVNGPRAFIVKVKEVL